MGPKEPASTVLTKAEEALICDLPQTYPIALDHCLYPLQASLPKLPRSSLQPLSVTPWHQPSSGL